MRRFARAALAMAPAGLLACGGSTSQDDLGAADPIVDAATEAPPTVAAGSDVTPEVAGSIDAGPPDVVAVPDAGSPEASPACAAASDAVAARAGGAARSCTTVLRVSDTTHVIQGYRMLCGPYAHVDEAAARTQGRADTGVGQGCFAPGSITGAAPVDDFVFVQPASAAACACCGDGWVTAVSARTALTVLGATIAFGPDGGIAFPETWDAPSDLGIGCGSAVVEPQIRGFDLTQPGGPGGQPPPPIDAATLQPVVDAVWSTALPEGLGRAGYVFDGVVLRYGGAALAPGTTEWIVLLNSGWLE